MRARVFRPLSGFLSGRRSLSRTSRSTRLASTATNATEWNCAGLFPPELPFAVEKCPSRWNLIVANANLPKSYREIWRNATVKICADGGANRIYDSTVGTKDQLIPDVIRGDMDSIRKDVLEAYRDKGVSIIIDGNQDTTDLDKAFMSIDELPLSSRDQLIIVLGGLGGNISQEFANFGIMFSRPEKRIIFVGDSNIAFLLHPGEHIVHGPPGIKCGLLPFGGTCRSITTSGLRWNLEHNKMNFGGLISSSNVVVNPVVTVKTLDPVLWTFDLDEYNPSAQCLSR